MAIKDLLVYLDQSAATDRRLESALTLAQRLDAHVTALHLIAEPFLRGSVMGGTARSPPLPRLPTCRFA